MTVPTYLKKILTRILKGYNNMNLKQASVYLDEMLAVISIKEEMKKCRPSEEEIDSIDLKLRKNVLVGVRISIKFKHRKYKPFYSDFIHSFIKKILVFDSLFYYDPNYIFYICKNDEDGLLAWIVETNNIVKNYNENKCFHPCRFLNNCMSEDVCGLVVSFYINHKEYLAKEGDLIKDYFHKIPLNCSGGKCGKCVVKTNLGFQTEEEKKILSNSDENLFCLLRVKEDLCINYTVKNVQNILNDFDKEGIKGKEEGIVLAIDIGTTTIAGILYDKKINKVLKEFNMLNPLVNYGIDVISRSSYIIDKKTKTPMFELRKELNKLIDESINIYKNKIVSTVICGNTINLHILLGLNLSKLMFYPYINQIDKNIIKETNDIIDVSGKLIIPQALSNYIGPDVTLGFMCIPYKENINVMYLDFGTNGEVVFKGDYNMYCVASAAGPAFEGASISCGSIAQDGAIYSFSNKDIKYLGSKPTSICGSGIIDVLAYLIDEKIVDKTGYMNIEEFYLANDIYLNKQDIREIQLAKAAIMMHIKYLTSDCVDTISKFYIAGGFGSYLNIKNAIRIGLLPNIELDKFVVVKNTALKGALMMGIDLDLLREHDELLKQLRFVELISKDNFQELYIKNMEFEEE